MASSSRLDKYSSAEKLAYCFLKSDWLPGALFDSMKWCFRKDRRLLESLVVSVLESHVDRPRFGDLVATLESLPAFELALMKKGSIKRLLKAMTAPYPSLNWLDWGLPSFRDEAALASHLGVTAGKLHWLTALGWPADRRPDHYVARWVKKRSVGHRLIESPKATLKTVQRFILQDILQRVPVHQAAHGFCRGRSVVGFVDPHLSNSVCLRMDLKDFFPSLRGGRVVGLFRSLGYDHSLARMLMALTTTQTKTDVVGMLRPPGSRGVCEESKLYLPFHLPQGAPTSPAIANLLAYRFDCRLTGLADSMGVAYTRYADDLLFSGDREFGRAAKGFAETVGAIAMEEGLQVNFRKTRVQYPSQRQHAVGIVINEKTNCCRTDFDLLKATLFNCVRTGPAKQNRESHPNFREHLVGRINWVGQLNVKRGETLMTLFNQIDWSESDADVVKATSCDA